MKRIHRDFEKFDEKRTDLNKVAELTFKVLKTKSPKTRYPVVYMSGFGTFFEMLPQSWVDYIMMKREKR